MNISFNMEKMIISLVLLGIYLCLFSLVRLLIQRIGSRKKIRKYRIKYTVKTLQLSLTVIFAILIFLVFGIQYSQVVVFLSSFIAVMGVVLFAQWSVLSNVTTSLIIFFGFPYRVGDYVTVLDKDAPVEGVIEEIGLFHVIIKREGDFVTYPNTMILQKAVVVGKKKV